MAEKVMMLGNAAIARGAYEAGVKVSAAYPGTPSTEISECIVKYDEIYAEWSPNEKVAMEVAIGASIAGVRALASMKHVGVNVAADPLYTVSYIGVNGGLVLVAADDPGLYSSQNEQDSRAVARAAKIPVLEPSDSMEAKEFVKEAFRLSELYDTPVMIRTTTRLSHSQGMVELSERVEPEDKPYERNVAKNVMMPGNAKKRHPYVEYREKKMAEDGCGFAINRAEYRDPSIGVITSGIPYQYVREALPDASVLKLGMVNPLPRGLIEEFASRVDKLYIVEELDPIIEEQVRSWGIRAYGKELLTVQGEYSANMLREAIGGETLSLTPARDVVARPPILCPGCPHRSVFSVLKNLKIHAAGDIGCYTLGNAQPLDMVDTCLCMGADVTIAQGLYRAEPGVKTFSFIGDSTFFASGITGVVNAVYNEHDLTLIVLDNATTAMTGHQPHPGTGKTMMGAISRKISIPDVLKAVGVQSVVTVDPLDLAAAVQAVQEAAAQPGVTAVIFRSPCIAVTKPAPLFKVEPDKCIGCRKCIRELGCPAIVTDGDGVRIDPALCYGCGICAQVCPFDAIGEVKQDE